MKTGLTYTSTVVVSKENVAATMGSGDLNVFATPSMVALMENAAMSAVADELPEGSTTVGAMMGWRTGWQGRGWLSGGRTASMTVSPAVDTRRQQTTGQP